MNVKADARARTGRRLLWPGVAGLAAFAQACVVGNVADPRDDTGVVGTVSTYAYCEGDGCSGGDKATAWHVTTSDHGGKDGEFWYDAYTTPRAVLAPAPGREALEMRFEAAGFEPRTLAHKPRYQELEQEGQRYQYTALPHKVYLCPDGAADSDYDGVCDLAEARYQTDPYLEDTDRDGLSDALELFGEADLDLAAYGANPRRRDVFVELDYYPGRRPSQAVLDEVIAAFANAPLANPDGSTGISLHILLDQEIAQADADQDLNPAMREDRKDEFTPIRKKYFDERRARAFHYGLFAAKYDGGNSSGLAEISGQYFIVTLSATASDRAKAGTLMHELGHNLGLLHGGHERSYFKPNYFSVMNYTYQFEGVRYRGGDVLDYSRVGVSEINEARLYEPDGMAPGAGTTEAELANYQPRICRTLSSPTHCTAYAYLRGNASANLDFSNNGSVYTGGTISADLNGDGNRTTSYQHAQNDWRALTYDGGEIGGGVSAQSVSGPEIVTCDSPSAP